MYLSQYMYFLFRFAVLSQRVSVLKSLPYTNLNPFSRPIPDNSTGNHNTDRFESTILGRHWMMFHYVISHLRGHYKTLLVAKVISPALLCWVTISNDVMFALRSVVAY